MVIEEILENLQQALIVCWCLEFLQFGPRAGDATTLGERTDMDSRRFMFMVDSIVDFPTPIAIYGRQLFSAKVFPLSLIKDTFWDQPFRGCPLLKMN